jgi:hypothetical protein
VGRADAIPVRQIGDLDVSDRDGLERCRPRGAVSHEGLLLSCFWDGGLSDPEDTRGWIGVSF